MIAMIDSSIRDAIARGRAAGQKGRIDLNTYVASVADSAIAMSQGRRCRPDHVNAAMRNAAIAIAASGQADQAQLVVDGVRQAFSKWLGRFSFSSGWIVENGVIINSNVSPLDTLAPAWSEERLIADAGLVNGGAIAGGISNIAFVAPIAAQLDYVSGFIYEIGPYAAVVAQGPITATGTSRRIKDGAGAAGVTLTNAITYNVKDSTQIHRAIYVPYDFIAGRQMVYEPAIRCDNTVVISAAVGAVSATNTPNIAVSNLAAAMPVPTGATLNGLSTMAVDARASLRAIHNLMGVIG